MKVQPLRSAVITLALGLIIIGLSPQPAQAKDNWTRPASDPKDTKAKIDGDAIAVELVPANFRLKP